MLTEWASASLYASSDGRANALPLWLNHYNYKRPHGSLNHRSTGTRLNNVARNYNSRGNLAYRELRKGW